MKRLGVALIALCLLGAAAAFSRTKTLDTTRVFGDLAVRAEARNPWTHVSLNNDPEEFQFAIVSDRTGGHRDKIFSRAVEKLKLMQPEFVVSVGDLIEGGNKPKEQLEAEWKEFDEYVARLPMPFFYVPGNHDVGVLRSADLWKERLGRRYYHFRYKNVLFVCLNSEDPPGAGAGRFSKEQIEFVRQTLAANRDVRWTIVALHKPVWTAADQENRGWLDIEKALADRPYTVFCGHVHRYQKFVRNGRNYYQLATTGGGSKMRGVPYGEFDHIVWVTMKKAGPVFANVMLDAILPDDLRTPESNEKGVSTARRQPTHPVRGRVYFDGSPAAGAYVVFHRTEAANGRVLRADGLVDADGSFVLSTYTPNDGAPAGDYKVTVVWRQPFLNTSGRPGPNRLPNQYARAETTPLTIAVKAGQNDVAVDVAK